MGSGSGIRCTPPPRSSTPGSAHAYLSAAAWVIASLIPPFGPKTRQVLSLGNDIGGFGGFRRRARCRLPWSASAGTVLCPSHDTVVLLASSTSPVPHGRQFPWKFRAWWKKRGDHRGFDEIYHP